MCLRFLICKLGITWVLRGYQIRSEVFWSVTHGKARIRNSLLLEFLCQFSHLLVPGHLSSSKGQSFVRETLFCLRHLSYIILVTEHLDWGKVIQKALLVTRFLCLCKQPASALYAPRRLKISLTWSEKMVLEGNSNELMYTEY